MRDLKWYFFLYKKVDIEFKKKCIFNKKNDDFFIYNIYKMKEVEFDSVEEDLLFVICI